MGLSKVLLPFVSLCFFTFCASLRTQEGRARVQITKPRSTEDLYVADIEAFGEKFELTLSPLDDIWSKNARIMSFSKGNKIELLEKTQLSKRTRVYHDQASGAVLTVDDGNINGVLDSHHTITGSNGVHFAYKSDMTDDRYDDLEVPKNDSDVDAFTRYLFMDDDDYLEVPLNNIAIPTVRKNRDDSWNVEVGLVIDSFLSAAIGTDQEIYCYLTIFWNAVNERYKNIVTPKLNIKLVGAYIIRDESGEPFITSNIYSGNTFKGSEGLISFSRWIASNINSLPPHDLLYLQTGRDMVSSSGSSSLAGIAWRPGICLKYSTISYSAGAGEDIDAYFSGVHTATHEVAHILGAPHDGQGGSVNCPWSDGYIMSYVAGTINRLFFSECSKAQMALYTNRACLNSDLGATTPPNVFDSTSSLPGELYTMDEQCQHITGKSNAYVDTSVSPQDQLCYNLICKYYESPYLWTWTTFVIAAEGSPCPNGGVCRNGACV